MKEIICKIWDMLPCCWHYTLHSNWADSYEVVTVCYIVLFGRKYDIFTFTKD